MPAILKDSPSYFEKFYHQMSILSTNFLAREAGYIVAKGLVRCRICTIVANLRAEQEETTPQYLGWMLPELLPHHEEDEHYGRRLDATHPFRACVDYVEDSGRMCEECLNMGAIELKIAIEREELEEARQAASAAGSGS
jgi:hypothetical protein